MAQSKLELLLELKNRLKGGLASAKNTVFSELKDMKSKLNDFSSANLKAFKGISDEIPMLGRAVSLLANPYALAAAAALSFAAAGVKATNMALDWEHSMRKVNVTAQLNRKELDGLSKQLLYIGAQGSTELMEVPQAFNRIISAGLDVNQSMEALVPTLKAAKAGFTDIETVAGAGIGVMKSSGENINVVYDTLFATLNKGNAEFKDIAQYLPKIIPGARLAGAQLYETAGAFAFLTAQGQTAEQSTTGMMNAFKALSDPRFTKGFKEAGINVFDKGKFRGLLPIVTDLSHRLKGLNDEQTALVFKTIGLDQEARMAFGSMIQNVSELGTTIDFVKNSTGQLEEALKNSEGSTEGWARAWNKVKFLAIEFGENFIPIIDYIGEKFDWLMSKMVDGTIALKGLIAGVSNAAGEIGKILLPIGEALANVFNPTAFAQSLAKLPAAFAQTDFKGAFEKGFKDTIAEYRGKASTTPSATSPGAVDDTAGTTPGSPDNIASGPAAHQSKSIVINIDAMHKGDNKLSVSGEGMSLTELERKMTEIFMRTIRNVEASY